MLLACAVADIPVPIAITDAFAVIVPVPEVKELVSLSEDTIAAEVCAVIVLALDVKEFVR